jgi:hypothetical protein
VDFFAKLGIELSRDHNPTEEVSGEVSPVELGHTLDTKKFKKDL